MGGEIMLLEIAIMTGMVRDLDKTVLNGLKILTNMLKMEDQVAVSMLVAALDPNLNCQSFYFFCIVWVEGIKKRILTGFVAETGVYLDDCQIRRPAK